MCGELAEVFVTGMNSLSLALSHCLSSFLISSPTDCSLTLPDPSEKVSLQIMPRRPIVEGDNVTLKCQADGNPPPSSFYFHIKVSRSIRDTGQLMLNSLSAFIQ